MARPQELSQRFDPTKPLSPHQAARVRKSIASANEGIEIARTHGQLPQVGLLSPAVALFNLRHEFEGQPTLEELILQRETELLQQYIIEDDALRSTPLEELGERAREQLQHEVPRLEASSEIDDHLWFNGMNITNFVTTWVSAHKEWHKKRNGHATSVATDETGQHTYPCSFSWKRDKQGKIQVTQYEQLVHEEYSGSPHNLSLKLNFSDGKISCLTIDGSSRIIWDLYHKIQKPLPLYLQILLKQKFDANIAIDHDPKYRLGLQISPSLTHDQKPAIHGYKIEPAGWRDRRQARTDDILYWCPDQNNLVAMHGGYPKLSWERYKELVIQILGFIPGSIKPSTQSNK